MVSSPPPVLPLLIATRNPHKTGEFAALLGSDFAVTDLTAHDLPPVEESGGTFAENAILKATAASRVIPGLVVADDSGLEVHSFGGAPGVYSARYAGKNATDEENVAKLLAAMRDLRERDAQFRCVLAVADSGEVLATFEGIVRGRIAHAHAGPGGFGYDPVFVPDGHDRTFTELGPDVKNTISHRARAVLSLREYLLETKRAANNAAP